MISEQLSGQFDSCAMIFTSESERSDFSRKELTLLPEGSSYRINLFDRIVEIKMPESFLHSATGPALGDYILKQVTTQLYLPGIDVDTLDW